MSTDLAVAISVITLAANEAGSILNRTHKGEAAGNIDFCHKKPAE
jgi:hypothetical protein